MLRLSPLVPQRPYLRPPLLELDYRPPAPWAGSATPPDIVDMQTYADVHRWADIKIGNYIVRPRANYAVVPSHGVLDTLQRSFAFELFANNAEARIAFTEIGLAHILADPDIQRGPVCFVTLVPSSCAHPVGDNPFHSPGYNAILRPGGSAAKFEVHLLRQIARQALGDIPFIGMIEAALFYRWGPEGRARRDWISWHCHLLTWGTEQREVSRVLAPFRARHSSMLEGVAAAHVQSVPEYDLARQLVYMMKAPQKITRISYYPRPWTSPTTGEVKPSGFHPQKDWLQTGHRVRMLDVIGHRKLDDLFFGNRAGTALRRATLDEVLAPFHAWERRQPLSRRL